MNEETGETTLTFEVAGSTLAYIKPLRGRELVFANQTVATVTHEFHMYWNGVTRRLTPKWKLRYDDREFGITYVINVEEQNRDLEVMAIEEVA